MIRSYPDNFDTLIDTRYHRFEYVLDRLEEADELRNGLSYTDVLVDSLTVEELLGGLELGYDLAVDCDRCLEPVWVVGTKKFDYQLGLCHSCIEKVDLEQFSNIPPHQSRGGDGGML